MNYQVISIRHKLKRILARCLISQVKDEEGVQKLQLSVFDNEVIDSTPRYQNYGFTSNPRIGAEAITVFNDGDRSSGIAIAIDDRRFRLKGLKEGEVAIYTDEGDSIILSRNNVIKIKTKSFKLDCEECDITAKKFRVSDGNSDIVATLTDWMEEVIGATTNTMLGPMKLIGAGLPALKQKLERFKL
ncbi:MAG: phage baseplate assembly protein [Pseudobacteriovorax sp.]|nr:phage baseplate assembly protein [Pseudobacteriovorax sp.]